MAAGEGRFPSPACEPCEKSMPSTEVMMSPTWMPPHKRAAPPLATEVTVHAESTTTPMDACFEEDGEPCEEAAAENRTILTSLRRESKEMVRLRERISGSKLLECPLGASVLRRFSARAMRGCGCRWDAKGSTNAPGLAVYQAQLERNEGVLLADDELPDGRKLVRDLERHTAKSH
jgi:hypothetical protein